MMRYLSNLFYCTKGLVLQASACWLKRHPSEGIFKKQLLLKCIIVYKDKIWHADSMELGWRYQVTKILDITELKMKENRYYSYATAKMARKKSSTALMRFMRLMVPIWRTYQWGKKNKNKKNSTKEQIWSRFPISCLYNKRLSCKETLWASCNITLLLQVMD